MTTSLARVDAWGTFSVATMRKWLVATCRRLEVRPFRVYDLRHTFALALRQHGADLADIAAQLGHSSPRLTRRYAPTISAKLRAATNRIRVPRRPAE
ncbi:MAG: tyrosine-type recombinase/integrase [Gemmatimonadetes bacterium]|nr:tyrosine-type recombinase/integrase [Gemmatimonadota bacterium]